MNVLTYVFSGLAIAVSVLAEVRGRHWDKIRRARHEAWMRENGV